MATVFEMRWALSLRNARWFCLIATLAIMVALVPASGFSAGATGAKGSITIHASRCPAGFAGPHYFEVCHERWFGSVTFTFSGPESFIAKTPGSGSRKGIVSEGGLTPGTYSIDERLPVGTVDFLVYCSYWDPDRRVRFSYTSRGIQLTLKAGTDVLCDWFHVPAAAVATTDLNHRAGPSVGHDVLRVIPKGEEVELTGRSSNGFLSVLFNGRTGWASARFLDIEATTAATTTELNLRAGPGSGHKIIAVIPGGAPVELTGMRTSGFLSVRYRGLTGWVSAQFLEMIDP